MFFFSQIDDIINWKYHLLTVRFSSKILFVEIISAHLNRLRFAIFLLNKKSRETSMHAKEKSDIISSVQYYFVNTFIHY